MSERKATRVVGLRHVFIALALGFITTIAFAVALGYREPSSTTFRTVPGSMLHKRIDATGSTLYQLWILSDDGLTTPAVPDNPSEVFAELRAMEFTAPTPAGFAGNLANILEWNADEWGWPMRCLWTWHARPWNGPLIENGPGMRLPDRQYTMPGTPRFLPMRPMWTGLTLNTLLYASTWFVLLFLFAKDRQVRRMLRRQCQACGYDLRGANSPRCPECGADT